MMALSNKNIGQDPGKDPGFPSPGMYNPMQEEPASGREYAKELLIWAGKVLKQASRGLYVQLVKVTTIIPQRHFNGVDTRGLDRRMRKINWNKDYYSQEAIAKGMRNARLQRDIMRVSSIFRDLKNLSDSGHYRGEEFRWKLQRKYWANTRMHPHTGNTLETVVAPANYMSAAKKEATEYKQDKEKRMDRKPVTGNTVDVSKRQQENEARRIRIAKAGATLLTSLNSRQNKPKKGLGI